jgi:hypothetical protein
MYIFNYCIIDLVFCWNNTYTILKYFILRFFEFFGGNQIFRISWCQWWIVICVSSRNDVWPMEKGRPST